MATIVWLCRLFQLYYCLWSGKTYQTKIMPFLLLCWESKAILSKNVSSQSSGLECSYGQNYFHTHFWDRRICKPRACGSWFTNSSRVLPASQVVYYPSNHRNLCSIAFSWLMNQSAHTDLAMISRIVIGPSGVQFCLKSYAWFQNRTRAACSVDLKSQVWF